MSPGWVWRIAALRIAEAETAREFTDYRIVDRLEVVVPAAPRRTA